MSYNRNINNSLKISQIEGNHNSGNYQIDQNKKYHIHDVQTQGLYQDQKNNTQLSQRNSVIYNKNSIIIYSLLIFVIALIGSFVFFSSNQQIKIQRKQINNYKNAGQITSIFVISNQEKDATESIQSYLKSMYEYQKHTNQRLKFNNIIVGYTKKVSKQNQFLIKKVINQINQVVSDPIQVRWVQRKNLQSQMQFINNLLKLVTSQYFFFSTTSYIYEAKNQVKHQNSIQYIELSLKILSSNNQTSQLIIYQNDLQQLNNQRVSFRFSPALHRTSDYHFLKDSFQQFDELLKLKMIEAQKKISDFIFSKKKYIMQTHKSFGITRKYIIERKISKASQVANSNFKSVSNLLKQIQKKFYQPRQYFQFSKLKQIKQLPICAIIVPSKLYPVDILIKSIKNQNYENYIIIQALVEKQRMFFDNQINQISENYFYFLKRIKIQCKLNSLLVFVRSPLVPSAFFYLNQKHQNNWVYLTYSESQHTIQIHSFFYRIYQLISKNDFSKKNTPFLEQNNIEVQTLALLQISSQFIMKVQKSKIMLPNYDTYFYIRKDSNSKYDRTQYDSIHRLSHDMPIKIPNYNNGSYNYTEVQKTILKRAIQRQQLWYLPQNHTIQQIQFIQLNQLYNIGRYKNKSRQVRFCLTVLSHNNVQNDRYKKVLKSIVRQKYDNYHIVFIDDNSDDNTMNATIQYMKKIQFPKERIRYVHNLQRTYASYNIINSGFNFCDENDVQMLMDGDDEFIGKYAFQVMNSAYQFEDKQNKQVWVAHSTYKNNSMFIGSSRGLNQNFNYEKRPQLSVFGPIRTWRVKVIYNIPPKYHKQQNGKWLNTVYDDALFYPLFEISSSKRVIYFAQILYQYNQGYGDNDNSNQEKLKNRLASYLYIKTLPRLNTLKTLQGSIRNSDLVEEFNRDKNVKFKTIDIR